MKLLVGYCFFGLLDSLLVYWFVVWCFGEELEEEEGEAEEERDC